MKLLKALKDAYLNRRILSILFKNILLWICSLYVSYWIVGGLFFGTEVIQYPLAFGLDGLLFLLFLLAVLWMTAGVFFYLVSLFYWYYFTRDRNLDDLTPEHRYAISRDVTFYKNWNRSYLGCFGTLFVLAWDLLKFLFIGQLLALTWIFWVRKSVEYYY